MVKCTVNEVFIELILVITHNLAYDYMDFNIFVADTIYYYRKLM